MAERFKVIGDVLDPTHDPLATQFEIFERSKRGLSAAVFAKILNQIRKGQRGRYPYLSEEWSAYNLGVITAINLVSPYLRRALR